MAYTPEIFNRYNQHVEESRNAVCRHIQYLLKPADDYPKGSDVRLKELYNVWRADCRAMNAACETMLHLVSNAEMIEMPPNDEEHFLCRRMAAVIIERNIFGEHEAQQYLPELVRLMKMSTCYKHSNSCACHILSGWTYGNNEIAHELVTSYLEKERVALNAAGGGPLSYQPAVGGGRPERVVCAGWRDCTCGGCSGGGASTPYVHNTEICACGACHRARVTGGTQDAYMAKLRADTDRVLAKSSTAFNSLLGAAQKADNAIASARAMPGGATDDGFVKNLFKTVQGVNYDDKCPHDLPFYACMSCSH